MIRKKQATDSPDGDRPTVIPPPRRRVGRLFWRVVWGGIMVIMLLAALSVVLLIDRDVRAPGWVTARVETAASDALGGQVSVAEMFVTLGRDLHPRVRLRDLSVVDAQGAPVAEISQIAGLMSPRGLLLRGDVLMQDIVVSDVRIDLQRDADGSVAVAFDTRADVAVQRAEGLTELLDQADHLLQQESLAALETIRAENLVMAYTDKRANRRWTVDGGSLSLDLRDGGQKLRADLAVLSGGAGVTTLVFNYDRPRDQAQADLGLMVTDAVVADIATQVPALNWLSDVKATMSATLRTTLEADGGLGPLSAALEMGAGALQPSAATAPVAFDGAKVYLVLDDTTDTIRFDLIEVASDFGAFKATGQAILGAQVNGLPQSLVAQLAFRGLELHPTDNLPAALNYDVAQVDLRLNLAPFAIDIGQFFVRGDTMATSGKGRVAATDAGWDVALDLQSDAIAQADILAHWPLDLKPKLRKWVTENLQVGTMHDVHVGLRAPATAGPDTPVRIDGHFGFSDSLVRYLPLMSPVTQAAGTATFGSDRFTVTLDRGRVTPPTGGVLDVSGSTMVISDTTQRRAPTQFDLRIEGAITAIMSLMNQPPFRYADRFNIPVDFAQAQATTRLQLAMPMSTKLAPGEVRYRVDATVRDFVSSWAARGRRLTSDRLFLGMDNDGMVVTGDATLDGVAISGTWDQPFDSGGRSTVAAQIALSPQTLANFNIALPDGMVSGEGQAQLDLAISPGAPADYTLTSNLRGLRLEMPALGWVKSPDVTGDLELTGRLGARPSIESLSLAGGGLNMTGRITVKPDGSMDRAVFERLRVGGWLDVPVTLRGRGAGLPAAVDIRGGYLDLGRLPQGRMTGGQGAPMSVALDRLQVSDSIALERFSGDLNSTGGLSGTFTAQVNGAAAVTGTLAPSNGATAVRIESDDAGAVLRAAGFARTVTGGRLDLRLVPTGEPGTFDGVAALRRFRVRDAPVVAGLLDAVSIIGALQQLDGQGLWFDEADARFRLTPDRVIVTQSSTVGAGLGISLDGIYTLATKAIDFQGVISPFYLVNGIGSVLTREGEGLIGFNFNLGGTARAPQLDVNPLSILTPGMFRDIFRRPPPVVPQ